MKLGTEDRNKVAVLGVLVVAAGYFFYSNVLSQPGGSAPEPARVSAPPAANAPAPVAAAPAAPRRAGAKTRSDEFRPTMGSKRPEDRVDPASIDPTLRLDLLEKVQAVGPAGGSRNLFQFGAAPVKAELPKGPEPRILPKKASEIAKTPEPSGDPDKPVEAPPPPINLKYYGFSTVKASGQKTAFFLDGEEILVAPEGQTVKRRYRVVRIGPASVVMEDTESKRQQTLTLQAELAG